MPRWTLLLAALTFASVSLADDDGFDPFEIDNLNVNITKDMGYFEIEHNGEKVTVLRNQNPHNVVKEAYAKTSRNCPPFCVQPMTLAPGVETIGELELIDYLQRKDAGDDSIIVLDSRTADWSDRGTIPGAVNLPWDKLSFQHQDADDIADILEEEFDALRVDGFWDFRNAKTLVMFCNGNWCGQSPTNIKMLLSIGYPAHKLKWYRAGVQGWENLGFKTVKP